MAKEPASVQLTGGAGFEYEDQVAAFFATAMLAGTQPLGLDIGGVVKLDWQTRESGWLLDDLLVTLARPSTGHLAISIKSDRQVTGSGFPATFVTTVWEQWLGLGTPASTFGKDADLLGLVVGELANEPSEDWNELLRQARLTDSSRLAKRYTTEGVSSEGGRKLFASLKCPASIATTPPASDEDIAALVRHIRLVYLDFTAPTSRDTGDSLFTLQRTLATGSPNEARTLWERLCRICTTRRTAGGSLTREQLLGEIRGDFPLRDVPDHASQWTRLQRLSAEYVARVKLTVGSEVRLNRNGQLAQLHNHVAAKAAILVTGATGCGKSAVVRLLAENPAFCSRFLWLDAEILGERTPTELEARLGSDIPIQTLLAESSPALSTIILDGLDRFSPKAISTVAALLSSLSKPLTTSGWVVIATARTEESAELLARLHQAGLSNMFATWPLPQPSHVAIQSALAQLPALTHLATRRTVVDALRNLKVFDWVASVALSATVPDANAWVGHMDVLDWVWQGWLGTGPGQVARANALKSLGVLEADQLISGVGLLKTAELGAEVIEDLRLLGLVRLEDERVFFDHDLVGDVSRLRVLIEHDAKAALLARATSPRWHTAIRLLGQRLAERTTATDRPWRRVFDTLDDESTESALCRNLLIEGVSLAVNAQQLVDLLWPDLCAGDGALLNRFLEAFRYVATIPDPRIDHVNTEPEMRAELEANVRVPYWPYWLPMLSGLVQHIPDLCRLAAVQTGQLVGLWLRTMPIGSEGRREAVMIALALGKEIQAARGEHFRAEKEEEEIIFEAVLNAAPEFPDEVAQLALELAQRRPEPTNVKERRKRFQEAERRHQEEWIAKHPESSTLGADPFFDHDDGRMAPQLEDGPQARVDSGFQSTVLGGQAITTLAMVRPNAAREVLLACSLRPPYSLRFGEHDDVLRRHGIESADRGRPPIYSSGPWLCMLRQNPPLAVDVIVRLANIATANWAISEKRFFAPDQIDADLPTILVRFNGTDRKWTGDWRVFGWHRNILIGSKTMVCALMALERWLYDQVDAGQPVGPVIQQVWNTSTSVALLGVLTSLALRNPELLDDPLKPLLGIWQLDEWSNRLAMDGDIWRMELMLWHRYGEVATREAIAWNAMPHRKLVTRERFVGAFLTRPGVRAAFVAVQEHWKAEAASSPESAPVIRRISARFDIANFTFTDQGDGKIGVTFEWPKELQAETAAQAELADKSLAFLSFPHRCRNLLDKTLPLTDDEAEAVWKKLLDLSTFELKSKRDDMFGPARRKEDICAGGIAVLAILAPDWLENHSEIAEWCADEIARITANPPASGPLDIPESVSTDSWHVFLAELAIHEFADSPDDMEMRWLAAESVMSRWHSTTRLAMQAAYRIRDKLGQEFSRLANLATLWAALSGTRYHYEETESERKRFFTRWCRLVSAFGRQTIPTQRLAWTEIGRVSREVYQRIEVKRYPGKYAEPKDAPEDAQDDSIEGMLLPTISRGSRERRQHPGYDLQVLTAAFGWLPEALALAGSTRQLAVELVENLLTVSTGMFPDTGGSNIQVADVDGTPYDFDRWVFDLVAEVLPQLETSAAASRLWRPILELGPGAHYWIEDFLNGWTTVGLQKSPSPEKFFGRWNEMISYAENSPRWSPKRGEGHPRLGGLWNHLLGLGLAASVIAAKENEHFLGAMIPVYEKWAGRWLHNSWTTSAFCHFLLKPGAKPLRLKAVAWLKSAITSLSDYRRDRDDVDDTVVRVLRLVWRDSSSQIAVDYQLKQDFLDLIAVLAAEQRPDALQLRDTVAKSISLS
jgi:hypothetical protein